MSIYVASESHFVSVVCLILLIIVSVVAELLIYCCIAVLLASGMEPNQQPQAGGNQEMSRAKTVINARRENAPTRARKTVLKAYGYVAEHIISTATAAAAAAATTTTTTTTTSTTTATATTAAATTITSTTTTTTTTTNTWCIYCLLVGMFVSWVPRPRLARCII